MDKYREQQPSKGQWHKISFPGHPGGGGKQETQESIDREKEREIEEEKEQSKQDNQTTRLD
jgi:hypothetical protein